ncbi:MAG: 4-hydroxy-2-oxoglutarate aldolase/2-deydro-3-deoxyphosphogluconate aldolase [Caulobacteraceae bacterium]|nr:4-hydroxy-2-oxoglutarate aldolase/2-deydro-3-deoxyphosphogluconate aldolase [Caulobacteraceae bacterium]
MNSIHPYLDAAVVMSVVTIADAKQAVGMARALVAGGSPVIEVTLRTAAALEAIRIITQEVEGAIVGAGTLQTPADLEACAKAGAKFAVSPGATKALLRAGKEKGAIPYLPAIATPSELMRGLDYGYDAFKLFPASVVGGPAMLKALGGPYPKIRFCPTGGISLKTAPDYLSLANVACIGGSWLTPAKAMEAGDWAAIEALAREAVETLSPIKAKA